MRWNYIVCGLCLLLMSSYLDTVRGPLLPLLTQSLSLKYSQSSWFLILGNVAAIGMTFLMIPLVRALGEKRLCVLILIFLAAAAVDSFWVESYSRLLLFAFWLGAGVAMAGAMTNLLILRGTDLGHRSRTLCALHLMYGLGSLLAPFVVRIGVARDVSWTYLVAWEVPVLLILALAVLLRIPQEPPRQRLLPNAEPPAKLWLQGLVVLAFALYVGGEVTLSMWMVTYLVDYRHMELPRAAMYASGFFAVMSVTRLACVIYLPSSGENKFLWGSLVLCLGFFVSGHFGWALGFSLAGILGPYFPLFLAKASREFPTQSQTLTLWILSCMQITLGLCHWLVGRFTDQLGIERTYWLPAVLILLALGALFLYDYSRRRLPVRAPLSEGITAGGVA